MMFGNKWSERMILPELREETKGKLKGYYCWRLETKKESYAHIFLCELEEQAELVKYWRTIVNQIAVYVQSEIESLLERSNFYVWFFVKGEVLLSLQKMIEDDAYSSKKFVIAGKQELTTEERLELIQKRLFVFDFPFEKSEKQMIEKVEMVNFRTYKEKVFDFSIGEGTARLVVLFAPNGMGKTSFFDGVEWNLTGEIDRFNELGKKKKSNVGEVVLKNKEAGEIENASVMICFNNGERIVRNVSKINNQTKRDTGKGNIRVYAKEELRKYLGMEEPWKNLILQHHKIDGFIAAKTPQDLYKEWGSLWDADGEKRAEFEKSFKERKLAEREFDKVVEEYKNLQKDCESLETGRAFAQKLVSDIERFQKASGKDTLGGVDFQIISSEEYVCWSNLVDQEVESYQKEYKKQEERLRYVQKELQADMERYSDIWNQLKNRQEQSKTIEKNLVDCHNKKILLLQEKEIEEKKEELIEKKELYCIVKEQGKAWYEQGKEYFELIRRKEKLEETIRELEENRIPELEAEIQRLELEYSQKKKNKEEEREYKSLCEHRKVIENLKQESEEIEQQIQACILEHLQSQLKINEKKERLERLKGKKLGSVSQVLQMYHTGKLGIDENEKTLEEERRQLWNVVADYDKREEAILKIDCDISLEEMLEEEMQKILGDARKLIEQQKLSRCPVCYTAFENQQKLLESTYRTSSEKGKQLKQARKEQENWLKILEKHIEQGIESYNIVLERLWEEAEEKWNQQIGFSVQKQEQKEQLERKLKEHHERMEQIQKEDHKQGIYVVYTQEGIDSWHYLWKEKQKLELSKWAKRLEEEKTQMNKYANMYEVFLQSLQSEKETELKIQQEMKDTFSLLKKIEVLLNEQTYEEAEKKLCEMEMLQTKLEVQQQVLREELEKYREITALGEEDYRQMLMDLQKGIQTNQEEVERIQLRINKMGLDWRGNDTIHLLQENNIRKAEQKICSDLKRIEEILRLLNPLKYNNEVKNYFSDWKACHERLEAKGKEKKEKEIKKVAAEAGYQSAKANIQNEMQTFLCQFRVNDIYQKLDPHEELKSLVSEFDFSEDGKGELAFRVEDKNGKTYPPEWYFSTAQLNVVAFSVFLGRALQAKDAPIKSILIDDPIGHFDDMNIVGFVDLLRNIIENTDRQLIISTHEERVFGLIQRKIPKEFYPVKYIDFRENES